MVKGRTEEFELVYHRTNDGEGILIPKYDDSIDQDSNNNHEYYYEG